MSTFKYSSQEINRIGSDGFEYNLPESIISILTTFATNIGYSYSTPINPNFVSTTVFKPAQTTQSVGKQTFGKKRRNREASEDEWSSFKTTKMEQRGGIDVNIDKIKLSLNKISDKTFLQMRENIINELDFIYNSVEITEEDNNKLCNVIYGLVSTNKFYSKIFADLYSELVEKYPSIKLSFNGKMNYENVMENYTNIQYVSPDENYDLFCDNNKQNELRKAFTTFYVNLSYNGLIEQTSMLKLLRELLIMIKQKINVENCKNEVDELTENIAILYKNSKELLEEYEDVDEYMIDDQNIGEFIQELSQYKSKNYLSLSNKAIFKFMDIIEE